MTAKPPIEIERKFLVARLPDLGALVGVAVRQGYLTGPKDSVEVRLRHMGEAFFLTLKSGAGLERAEEEIAIDRAQFDALWPRTAGRRVEKTRYQGRLADGQVFELDVYLADLAPLTVVEVEFLSVAAAQHFLPPEWFGKDVTEDAAFKNKALATYGLPAP